MQVAFLFLFVFVCNEVGVLLVAYCCIQLRFEKYLEKALLFLTLFRVLSMFCLRRLKDFPLRSLHAS